jgi:plastocyanin
MRRVLLAATLVTATVAFAAGAPAGAAPAVITATADQFYPSQVYVPQGTALTFFNADGHDHDVTGRDASFGSGPTAKEAASTVVGVESLPPGTYTFWCTIHTWMYGLLTVVGTSA